MNEIWESVFAIVGAICVIIILALLGALIGCWLWGVIAVGVFGLPALTFWQFYGLMILIHILFPSTTIRSNKK